MLKLLSRNLVMLLSLLLVGFILRLYFYSASAAQIGAESWGRLAVSFLHGARFDLSALIYVNVLIFLVTPISTARLSKYTAVLFSVLNTIWVALHLLDVEFFKSYGKRVDLTFLAAVTGTNVLILLDFLKTFTLVLIGLALFLYLFYRLYLKIYFFKETISNKTHALGYFFCVILFGWLAARGGTQEIILAKQHTLLFAEGNGALAQMTSNTLHNLIRSRMRPAFPPKMNAKLMGEGREDNLSFKPLSFLNKRPKNVMIIFMESLSSEVVSKLNVDFNKVFTAEDQEVLFTSRLYANGEISMDALSAVFFGIPSYFGTHIFKSNYSGNHLYGIGSVFKDEGLSRFFIHGATTGVQYFDVIVETAGIADFYSVKDLYDHPEEMSALWGVHDEFLYEKSLEIIKNYKNPFFGTIFTVSSHKPFVGTPNNLSGLGSMDEDYFASIDYAVGSLTHYFKRVKTEPWFKDTLFVVMGDHSPPILADWNMKKSTRYQLPMAMYFPGSNLGEFNLKRDIQQVDLPLSFFQLLGVKPDKWSVYGTSIFEGKEDSPLYYTDRGGISVVKSKEVDRYVYDLTKHSAFLEEGALKSETPILLESISKTKRDQVYEYFEDYIYHLEHDTIYQ